jgi:cyclopropane fatty-acyl-phospholipid synthase-like methyltransferase
LSAEYPTSVIEEVSAGDTMFRDRERYFRLGRNALDCIRLAMTAAGKPAAERILDLPCGYGRVLRWIKAEFPAAQLGACDIDHEGVDFCAATFGAEPVYGRENPADVEIEAPYDLIWSSSLFTHLPPHQWDSFLELFERALAPGELLIFTAHGRRIAELMHDPERRRIYQPIDHEALLREFEREGSAYVEYQFDAEQRERLSLPSTYGISLTRPSAVCAMLERRPGLRLVCYSEGRFNGQDLIGTVRLETP